MSDRPHSYAEEYGDPLGPARKPTASFERKRELWQRQIVADKDLLPASIASLASPLAGISIDKTGLAGRVFAS